MAMLAQALQWHRCSSLLAVAFSAGGDGGGKSPEHFRASLTSLQQPAIAVVRCVARRSAG
jgi:hypothetical protein